MENMTNKIFEMLLNDDTKYTVNGEKLDEIERLTTITRKALTPSYTCPGVLKKCHGKLLDMQYLLVKVISAEYTLKQKAVTIKQFFNYCEVQPPELQKIKGLLITAITNGYLKREDN